MAGQLASAQSEVAAVLQQVQATMQLQAQQLERQRQQLELQQQQLDELRRKLGLSEPVRTTASEQEQQAADSAASLHAATDALKSAGPQGSALRAASAPPAALAAVRRAASAEEYAKSPLALHFGNASLVPGGWVDFTGYYRSTNVGSGLGTAFASIPFNNSVQGGLSETRFTAQSSRISLRADEDFGTARVFGYAEADFNGYLPSNAYVSTNSDSMRLRVYFLNLTHGRWQLLGGQSWSLLTPNRVGVSPFLSEIYNTMHLDTNYQVGLTYARQAQLRAVYHVTPGLALGLSVENPEQYSGNAASFPALFSTAQTDTGSSSGGGTATPTRHPDVIAKLSADAHWYDRTWHFEAAGLLTGVAIYTPASITHGVSARDAREGGGISGSANLGLARNLHLILTGFWSDGGGRYLGGLGPGFVVAQPGSAMAPFQVQLVHSGSAIAAAEWQANRSNVLSFTSSGAYFGRASSLDPSTGKVVGYGFAGSPDSNNRALMEHTLASQTTLWSRPGYGAVQMITQGSWITRAPWYMAPDAPKNAHVFAGYANLRFVLP